MRSLTEGCYAAIVVKGVTSDGQTIILGVRFGIIKSAQVIHDLPWDLVKRGLSYEHCLPTIIDGHKALRKTFKDVFGQHILIHRCSVRKLRNTQGCLPKHQHA